MYIQVLTVHDMDSCYHIRIRNISWRLRSPHSSSSTRAPAAVAILAPRTPPVLSLVHSLPVHSAMLLVYHRTNSKAAGLI
jgi:hypothetical protein